ncbi:MAG: putative rRNA maturation factor YbeY [Acidimicrobiales bacterium]|jgi:probable rRNA maturation factor|nr:putative rRNA maturation factor YbeY [Acidimicrobiales bacterium]
MNGPTAPLDAMTIDVFVADEQSDVPVDAMRWIRLAREVLRAEGVKGEAELGVRFVDEGAMAHLNKHFLGNDGPTDVLAFPIDDDVVDRGRSPDSGGRGPGADEDETDDVPVLVGDVVVCPAVAKRNAPNHAGTYEDEMALLLVHGILHLMGMDHLDDDEAAAMEQRERDLLDRFHKAG